MTGGGSETAGAAGDRPRARAGRSGSVSDELPWRVRATRAAPAQQRWGVPGWPLRLHGHSSVGALGWRTNKKQHKV